MYKRIAVLGDQHIPYLDEDANNACIKLLRIIKPHKIIINGDVIDLWQLSSFDKDPARINTIQDDLDKTKEYFLSLRDDFPKTEMVYLYGNHEERMRKYLWRNASQIAGLRTFNLDYQLGLEEIKFKRVYEESTAVHREGELLITHGTIVSQESGMTARRMLRKYGMSVIHGHTHRLGSVYETKMGGSKGAWENGCLCRLNLSDEWGYPSPNWQQGFSIVYMSEKRFQVDQVFISEGELLWQGRQVRG